MILWIQSHLELKWVTRRLTDKYIFKFLSYLILWLIKFLYFFLFLGEYKIAKRHIWITIMHVRKVSLFSLNFKTRTFFRTYVRARSGPDNTSIVFFSFLNNCPKKVYNLHFVSHKNRRKNPIPYKNQHKLNVVCTKRRKNNLRSEWIVLKINTSSFLLIGTVSNSNIK